jgi:hypothetical protein
MREREMVECNVRFCKKASRVHAARSVCVCVQQEEEKRSCANE